MEIASCIPVAAINKMAVRERVPICEFKHIVPMTLSFCARLYYTNMEMYIVQNRSIHRENAHLLSALLGPDFGCALQDEMVLMTTTAMDYSRCLATTYLALYNRCYCLINLVTSRTFTFETALCVPRPFYSENAYSSAPKPFVERGQSKTASTISRLRQQFITTLDRHSVILGKK